MAGAGAGIVIGLDEDNGAEPGSTAGSAATSPPAANPPAVEPPESPGQDGGDRPLPPPEDDPQGAAPGPSGPPPGDAAEQAAASAGRGYVQALDRRAGAAVCGAFAPGALEAVEFPAPRSSCAATVRASLGFRRRGLPVWQHSQMTDAVSAEVNGDSARVVATVFTVYADVREPTIEDDLIYLERDGDRWLIAKPSLTLHRAIGNPDPPPSALTPP